MKSSIQATIVFVLLTFFSLTNAFGAGESSQRKGKRHNGPPPEAYTACEGKTAGDTAEFVNPRGETVTGICQQDGDQLVLRPDRNKNAKSGQKTGGRHNGPPPEAYTACEGKTAGDTSEFVNRRGETLTGICQQDGDQLVLRPDRNK